LKSEDAENYINAIKGGNVIAVNSFASSYLIEDKMVLALLWDKDFETFFTEEEIELARSITVKTQVVAKLSANDLLVTKKDKDQLVLKKGLDTRGRSVFIGKGMPQKSWDNIIDTCKNDLQSSYVIQEYKEHESYVDNQGITKYISHAYFVLAGEPQGMFTRFSTSQVTNVGKCGALGISFKLEEKN
jgi:protease II